MKPIPFHVIDWSLIEKSLHPGTVGTASWQVGQYPELRIRIVEYSAGYCADHWCQLGHIVHCLEGTLNAEMKSGEKYILKQGMTYVVTDGMSKHRSRVDEHVKLLIIDGDFLKSDQ